MAGQSQAAFYANLKKYYTFYTGGFITFVIIVGILEQMGVPNKVLGYLFLFATILLYAGIGFMSKTAEVAEYYVAGRRVPALFNGMATGADWMSAASFIVGAGYGDVSSERAYIRTESLSCVTRDGTAIDVPVKGYVAGEDGKAGMRGRLVSKQGQILANALLAGVASGIGHAFTQSSTTLSVSPLGTTSTVDPGKQLEAGLGTGVGKALDRLAQYYISLAEKVFPVIEVDAGRSVDVVLTQGVALPGTLDAAGTDPDNLAQLAERARTLRRNDDEDD